VPCRAYNSVGGSIKGRSDDQELWVKATPIRGAGGGETRVGRHGTFLIDGLDGGSYLLTVLDDTSVIHSETLSISGSKSIVVDLSKSRP
jgi:hypothetical protein